MSTAARRHRRVVALSAQDQVRVSRGEEPEAVTEERRRRGLDALAETSSYEEGLAGHGSGVSETANDARLLQDVPPHWG